METLFSSNSMPKRNNFCTRSGHNLFYQEERNYERRYIFWWGVLKEILPAIKRNIWRFTKPLINYAHFSYRIPFRISIQSAKFQINLQKFSRGRCLVLFNMSGRKFAGGIGILGILQEFRVASVKLKIWHTSLLSVTQ